MGDLFDFDICDKNCHIIRCMGSDSKEAQWAKMNTYGKRLSYIEKDCFEKQQNYFSTGDSRTEYSSGRPFPQKV
jgi:hypothetical protein